MSDFYANILKQYPHKIELHCHTFPVSACSQISASDMVAIYKAEGYSGLTLTNHFYPFESSSSAKYEAYVDEYIKGYELLREKGEQYGIKIYLGMEIRFEENQNDYLVYGIDEEFIRKGVSRKMKTLKDFVSASKREDNLIIQAHPFRNGMVLADSELLDGIEVYNVHPKHNSRVGFAAKYAEEINGVFTCGTDFHHQGQGALSALLTREIPSDSFELARCIKNEPVYKIGKSIVVF